MWDGEVICVRTYTCLFICAYNKNICTKRTELSLQKVIHITCILAVFITCHPLSLWMHFPTLIVDFVIHWWVTSNNWKNTSWGNGRRNHILAKWSRPSAATIGLCPPDYSKGVRHLNHVCVHLATQPKRIYLHLRRVVWVAFGQDWVLYYYITKPNNILFDGRD